MRIEEVRAFTRDLSVQRDFYAGALGLPATETPDGFRLQVGASRLQFRRAPTNWEKIYHLAFNVDPDGLASMRERVAAHARVLADEQGNQLFQFPTWNAESFYFLDPCGNILECIARRNLLPAGVPGLLSISEVGLPANDLPGTVKQLQDALGIPAFGTPGPEFAALGDDEGLLIVVPSDRIWHPNTGVPAQPTSVGITLVQGENRFSLSYPPLALRRL
jgi:catechol 2,3-dioxygenase-like lactoylglutathione lyase family enzyme